ncbi:MAG: Gfo/Idh/MocA family oxidoreductase [Chthoniobacteraceae bacterium]
MKTRFAFVGFRHSHAFDLLNTVIDRPDCEIVACCEEDAETRKSLASSGRADITHERYEAMLDEVECDVVAVGDYYTKRGPLVVEALRRGLHVICDKPLCHTLAEQAQIEDLSAKRDLSVGLQLDLRGAGAFIRLRDVIRSGELGAIHTMSVCGQHPLLLGSRPAWYFEKDKHGGTINDIGIHIFDIVPWLTGVPWREVVTARTWNAKATAFPHFKDAAQFMGILESGAGIMADVSYLAPDKAGYSLPHYWRFTVHGQNGMAETHYGALHVKVALDHQDVMDQRPVGPPIFRRFFTDFLNEVRGHRESCDLRTADVLRASRLALEAQRRAIG